MHWFSSPQLCWQVGACSKESKPSSRKLYGSYALTASSSPCWEQLNEDLGVEVDVDDDGRPSAELHPTYMLFEHLPPQRLGQNVRGVLRAGGMANAAALPVKAVRKQPYRHPLVLAEVLHPLGEAALQVHLAGGVVGFALQGHLVVLPEHQLEEGLHGADQHLDPRRHQAHKG